MAERHKNRWSVSAFDRDKGEFVTTWNDSYETIPEVEDLQELLVRQAPPVRITPTRRKRPERGDKLAVFFPDAQIPFHDERAVAAAHLAVRELQPDIVVMLGDMLDFPGLSRFETRPEYMGQIQSSLDRYSSMLAQVRADAPNSIIYALTGNHENRLQKSIIKNNAELLGIRRANASKELGVLTLDYLLRCSELEVEMIGGYPNGTLWLADHLRVIHGTESSQRQSTAAKYLDKDPHTSVVFGHSHRAEIQWRTTPTMGGYALRFAMSPGTLADINGSVPSYHSTVDEHGAIVEKAENWQQAVGIVEYSQHNANPELAMIIDGLLRVRGQRFNP